MGSIVNRLRRRRPLRIVGYHSYGPVDALVCRGRVLANRETSEATDGERRRRSVLRMARRFATHEVAGVEVEVHVAGRRATAVTDAEGYFSAQLALPDSMASPGRHQAEARIVGIDKARSWPIAVLIVGGDTRRLVISDVDDTLLLNGSGDLLRTVMATVGGTALSRQPVPGMPSLYQDLVAVTPTAPACPVFYVSSSPWNLYDFLEAFLNHNDFPAGPLLLRDYGVDAATLGGAHGRHKVDHIREILRTCPNAEVVLMGDSSQQDAAAFAEVMSANPRRVVGAFIRDVGDTAKARTVEAIASSLSDAAGPLRLMTDVDAIREQLDQDGWFA